ncbi:hypothetical protein PR048_031215 [Dryococelus australis]|uniref:Integrase catalytic domain-containing protein n=1 Tax=Dryococelus australis TaxID=614101 RepID=A0ABQ9G4M5_9NEOP|nr:hypothetical protein PR048_031215 [Dryococelus australis]
MERHNLVLWQVRVTFIRSACVKEQLLGANRMLFGGLAGSRVFTVMDLRNAYQQLEVGQESRKYLTVNTHLGMRGFPMAIASAPAIFQCVMDWVLQGVRGVVCYIDRGKVERIVRYLGHKIDRFGIHPTNHKIEAIAKAAAPENVTQLKSFLGTPTVLPQPTQQGTAWSCGENCQIAFQWAKEQIMSNKVLAPYVGGGGGGLLSHRINGEERSVLFASSTLSKAEQNYAHIDRGALAIIFAVKRFHKYLYVQKILLVTDHQPLRILLGIDHGIPTLANSRLQWWAVILAAYSYKTEYRKGVQLANADVLSHLPVSGDMGEVVYSFNDGAPELLLTHNEVTEAQYNDSVLAKVIGVGKTRIREELSLVNNCLTCGNRVVVLQWAVLNLLHDQHPRIVRMKILACSSVWWRLWTMIFVGRYKSVKLSHGLQHWQPGRGFMQIVCSKKRATILLVCDHYSKWVKAWIMGSTIVSKVIEKLISSFAIFGILSTLVTDNGPPFNSDEFIKFCKGNEIQVLKSPPYHPQSSGLAERGVQTGKKSRCKQWGARFGNGFQVESLTYMVLCPGGENQERMVHLQQLRKSYLSESKHPLMPQKKVKTDVYECTKNWVMNEDDTNKCNLFEDGSRYQFQKFSYSLTCAGVTDRTSEGNVGVSGRRHVGHIKCPPPSSNPVENICLLTLLPRRPQVQLVAGGCHTAGDYTCCGVVVVVRADDPFMTAVM